MSQFSNYGPFLLNNIKGSEPITMCLVSFYSILESQAVGRAKLTQFHGSKSVGVVRMPGMSEKKHNEYSSHPLNTDPRF